MILRILTALVGSWTVAGFMATAAWVMTQGSILSAPFSLRRMFTMTAWGTVAVFAAALVEALA